MNNLDTQLKELYTKILSKDRYKTDRTGFGTKSIFGYSMRFDVREGFPLTTLRKIHQKSLIHELLWFLGSYDEQYKKFGNTNIRYLLDNGVTFWTDWCYKNYKTEKLRKFQENDLKDSKTVKKFKILSMKDFEKKIMKDDDFAMKWGELGPVYGKQWLDFGGHKELVPNVKTYKETASNHQIIDTQGHKEIYIKGVNQINKLIDDLINNPDSRRLIVNAWNVEEIEDMLLPPCFEEDMLVKCLNRYKKIVDITVDDFVLTEDGSYQKVLEVMKTKYESEMLDIKVFGNNIPIKCTKNHPFLVKNKGYIKAEELSKDDYVGIPINKNSIIPSFKSNIKRNGNLTREITTTLDDINMWYMMGYYLGDGWLIHKTKKIFFTIANHQIDKIYPKIRKCLAIGRLNNSGKNCTKFETRKQNIFPILEQFGQYAHGKVIPDFVHNAPKEYIEMFLQGYQDADGCIMKNNSISYTTVSENLALGVQLLYAKLGKKCSIIHQKRPKTTIIENRFVNQRDTFSLNIITDIKNHTNKYVFDDNYLWFKIRKIEKYYFDGYVYNLSVANNHTYTVNNIVNHNCHMMFQCYTEILTMEERIEQCENTYDKIEVAKYMLKNNIIDWNDIKRNPLKQIKILEHFNVPERHLDLQLYQRSSDQFLGGPYNIASYSLLLHMLAQVVNMIPREFVWTIGDTHLYANSIEATEELLKREIRPLPKLKMNPDIQNIQGFRYEDFDIVDYNPHANIKVEVAV